MRERQGGKGAHSTMYKGMVGRVCYERRGARSSKSLSSKCRLYCRRGQRRQCLYFFLFGKFYAYDSRLFGTKKVAETYQSIHPSVFDDSGSIKQVE